MVEELKAVLSEQEVDAHGARAKRFLRDHGQALVEAMEQNDRSKDALRAAVIALAHASESNSMYTPTYELVVGALYGTKASVGGSE